MAVTVLVAASIIDTLLPPVFDTNTLVRSGVTATPNGLAPTVMGAPTTAPLTRSMTDTVPAVLFGTYARPKSVARGVTVIVAVTGALVALVAVKAAILPVPDAARPIEGVLLVQPKAVLGMVPLNATGAVVPLLQITWLAIAFTVGVGLTVMLNVPGVPAQVTLLPVKEGVTVIRAVTGAVPLLTALKDTILPVPDAGRPMEAVLLVQLYTVPATGPLKATAVVGAPLQRFWLLIAFTVAVGFTVMVKVVAGPGQPLADGVTVIVAVCTVEVLFVAVKEAILPLPLAVRPIDALELVQLYVVPLREPLKFTAVVDAPAHTV